MPIKYDDFRNISVLGYILSRNWWIICIGGSLTYIFLYQKKVSGDIFDISTKHTNESFLIYYYAFFSFFFASPNALFVENFQDKYMCLF